MDFNTRGKINKSQVKHMRSQEGGGTKGGSERHDMTQDKTQHETGNKLKNIAQEVNRNID